jgi:hypothetical protein
MGSVINDELLRQIRVVCFRAGEEAKAGIAGRENLKYARRKWQTASLHPYTVKP